METVVDVYGFENFPFSVVVTVIHWKMSYDFSESFHYVFKN